MSTLGNLRNAVALKIGMDNTVGSAEQQLIDSWLNEAVVDVLMRTHCFVANCDATLTAGSPNHTLDARILVAMTLHSSSSGTLGQCVQLSADELINRRVRDPLSSTSGGRLYYAVYGDNMLLVYPTPTAATVISFYYVPRPSAPMTLTTDDPSTPALGGIPVEFHKALEYYALWQGGDYDDDKSSEQGERYRGLYEQFCNRQIRPQLAKKGGVSLPRARTNRTRRILRSSNDVWPRG